MNVTESPYAEWLEELIQMILELKPEKIGICAISPGGDVLTGYYGDCGHVDKAMMSYHMSLDAHQDVIMANAREIIDAADEEDDYD